MTHFLRKSKVRVCSRPSRGTTICDAFLCFGKSLAPPFLSLTTVVAGPGRWNVSTLEYLLKHSLKLMHRVPLYALCVCVNINVKTYVGISAAIRMLAPSNAKKHDPCFCMQSSKGELFCVSSKRPEQLFISLAGRGGFRMLAPCHPGPA